MHNNQTTLGLHAQRLRHMVTTALLCTAAIMLTSACVPAAYTIKPPDISGMEFDGTHGIAGTSITVLDARPVDSRTFSHGRIPAALEIEGVPVDPPAFLATYLEKELVSRGIPATMTDNGGDLPLLRLKTFEILNHRANGFSPFVTLTLFSADLEINDEIHRIGAFVKRGKMPIWMFHEVIDPAISEPLSLIVKEIAAKVARHLAGAMSSDQIVDELTRHVDAQGSGDHYLDVYNLGLTNNPKATQDLVPLTNARPEYIRLAAISSLGIVQARDQFNLLASIYHDEDRMWQDRAMAIKAIGDLDTAEARQFLDQQAEHLASQPESRENDWTIRVIRLYQ